MRKKWTRWSKGILTMLLALAIGAALLVTITLGARPTDLVQASVRITSTQTWYTGGEDAWVSRYHWLSSDTLLYFQDVPVGLSQTTTFFGAGGRTWHPKVPAGGGKVIRYDVKTGKSAPLGPFTALFEQTHGWPTQFWVSPDGKRALWKNLDFHLGEQIFAADIEGRGLQRLPLNPGNYPYWLSDSQHWLDLLHQYTGPNAASLNNHYVSEVHVHDLRQPKQSVPLLVAADSPLNMDHVHPGQISVLPGNRLVALDLYNWSTPQPPTQAQIMEILIDDRMQTRRHVVHFPKNCQAWGQIVSPKGDRIAWLFKMLRVSPLDQLVHRVIPSHKVSAQHVLGIWISDSEGAQMHEVAEGAESRYTDKDLPPYEFQWTPDGKRLSFLYKNTLYALPIE